MPLKDHALGKMENGERRRCRHGMDYRPLHRMNRRRPRWHHASRFTFHASRFTIREIQPTIIVKRHNVLNGESVIRDNDALD